MILFCQPLKEIGKLPFHILDDLECLLLGSVDIIGDFLGWRLGFRDPDPRDVILQELLDIHIATGSPPYKRVGPDLGCIGPFNLAGLEIPDRPGLHNNSVGLAGNNESVAKIAVQALLNGNRFDLRSNLIFVGVDHADDLFLAFVPPARNLVPHNPFFEIFIKFSKRSVLSVGFTAYLPRLHLMLKHRGRALVGGRSDGGPDIVPIIIDGEAGSGDQGPEEICRGAPLTVGPRRQRRWPKCYLVMHVFQKFEHLENSPGNIDNDTDGECHGDQAGDKIKGFLNVLQFYFLSEQASCA